MDLLPLEVQRIVVAALKIGFLVGGMIILIINYFHAKEAKKMEEKIQISLPGSVHLAMTFHLGLAVFFVFLSTVLLFLL